VCSDRVPSAAFRDTAAALMKVLVRPTSNWCGSGLGGACPDRPVRTYSKEALGQGPASVIVPQAITYQDPIESFKRGRPWASYRSSGKLSRGPVVVFSTGMEGLDRAARLAQDDAISYVAWGDDDWLSATFVGARAARGARHSQQDQRDTTQSTPA